MTAMNDLLSQTRRHFFSRAIVNHLADLRVAHRRQVSTDAVQEVSHAAQCAQLTRRLILLIDSRILASACHILTKRIQQISLSQSSCSSHITEVTSLNSSL